MIDVIVLGGGAAGAAHRDAGRAALGGGRPPRARRNAPPSMGPGTKPSTNRNYQKSILQDRYVDR